MAITEVLLGESSVLSGLTPEQKAAIVTLSANDEATVLKQKAGEIHGRYDADIESITGVKKKDGQPTHEYLKSTLSDFKTRAQSVETLNAKITALESDKTRLQGLIDAGEGSTEIKNQLADAKSKLDLANRQLETHKTESQKVKSEYEARIKNTHFLAEQKSALSGIKLKEGYSQKASERIINDAISGIKQKYNYDLDDNGAVVFKDKTTGEIVANKKNNLNPYTLSELLTEELIDDLADSSAGGAGKGGAGGKGGGSGSGGEDTPDISSATNQVEADKIIVNFLLKKGVLKTDSEFGTKQTELRKKLEVSKLPIQG